ncbi:MAG: hypothetical protein D6681_18295, partial [Calditrichaeota bacterium]
MKRKLWEHLLSILFVGVIFLSLGMVVHRLLPPPQPPTPPPELTPLLELDFVDFTNPLHRALLKETLNRFFPQQAARHDSLLQALDRYREAETAYRTRRRQPVSLWSGERLRRLGWMYATFIAAYLIVMLLTYYGVQTLAVLRFVKMKQGQPPYLEALLNFLRKHPFPPIWKDRLRYVEQALLLAGKALAKGAFYMILFSPAYVLAYSFKTRFDTDTFLFLVLFGVLSNGLLITYTQKFFTFLVAESRKGYVETAMVKNLNNAYDPHSPEGIPYREIFRLRKRFPGHVFDHIYQNARYQYLSALKEQASFLITGLVIIEMALNIQGHLCYELLVTIYTEQYGAALL